MSDPDAIDPNLLEHLHAGDLVARAEFCDIYLPKLLVDRRWILPGIRDEHLIQDAAHTALIDFIRRPDRYDPDKLPILQYLRMAAQGDLRNLLAREQRHAMRRTSLDDVELSAPVGNDPQEAPDPPSGISYDLLRRRILEEIPDKRDQQAAQMIMDNIKDTAAYARLYGLTGLSKSEQVREVKRQKDRLKARMKRMGKRLRDG
ncbi:MAG: RNA polymerase sigma factor [Dehalococcoidia bacterium]